MTPEQSARQFVKEQARQLAGWNAQRRGSAADVVRILAKAEAKVQATLAGSPTQWQTYHLKKLRKALEQAMEDAGLALATAAGDSTARAFSFGRAALDAPLAAAGIHLELAPVVNLRQLHAMRTFTTSKMQGIAQRALRKIDDHMGLVIAGAQSPFEAANHITLLLQGDRGRALTVMRTEIGRAYATATHERMMEAHVYVPGLQKQWKKSGKLRSRRAHDLVHGHVRDIHEPFDVDGEEVMYPRAPGVSAKNSINCGCEILPFNEAWGERIKKL